MPLDFHKDTLKAIAQASGTQYAEDKFFPMVYWSANNEQFKSGYMNGTYYTNDCYPCVMLYPFVMSDGTADNIVFSLFESRGVKKEEDLIHWSKFSEIVDKMRKGVETCKKLINKKKLETIEGDFKDESN